MRQPEYFENPKLTRDKATEILDKSGLAYFLSLQEKNPKKSAYHSTHGKIGESHFSYELTVKATVFALSKYDRKGQIKWLKFIAKALGIDIQIKEE